MLSRFAHIHVLKKSLQLIDVACGLSYLHEQGPPIIHGDLRGVGEDTTFIAIILRARAVEKYSHIAQRPGLSC